MTYVRIDIFSDHARPGLSPNEPDSAGAEQAGLLERGLVDQPQRARTAVVRGKQLLDDCVEQLAPERVVEVGDRHVVWDLVVEDVGRNELDLPGAAPVEMAHDVLLCHRAQLLGELVADHAAEPETGRRQHDAALARAEVEEHVRSPHFTGPHRAPQIEPAGGLVSHARRAGEPELLHAHDARGLDSRGTVDQGRSEPPAQEPVSLLGDRHRSATRTVSRKRAPLTTSRRDAAVHQPD